MGVKVFYILSYGDMLYTGPAAYRKMLEVREQVIRANARRTAPYPVPTVPLTGGWRKKMEALYKPLEGIYYTKGALRRYVGRRGKASKEYRQTLGWIAAHGTPLRKPKPKPQA